jgi:hypothetical protein
MFCPSCKCEYLAGVKECAECGFALVDTLEWPAANPPERGELVSIWTGNDPVKGAAVKEALENAGISFTDQAAAGYFIFPSMRPRMEICVSNVDQDRAKKVLHDLEGRVDPAELTPEQVESMALPESDDMEGTPEITVQSESPDDWDDEEAASEVWIGENEEFANTLVTCLREIGIPSHKLGEAGRWHLLVRGEQEKRAREIVREVVEASPPE